MISAVAVAFSTSLIGVGALLPLLHAAGVIDVPNHRSSHQAAIPRGGGVATTLAVLAGSAVAALAGVDLPGTVLLGMSCFALLGLADDVRGLGVRVRLGAQLILGLTMATQLLLGQSHWSTVAILGSAVWVAAITNAFNFMDGINGISTLTAGLAGSWYAYVGIVQGIESMTWVGLILVGAVLGFMPWNFPNARIFLGDVGSYALGSMLALLAIMAVQAGSPLLVAVAPLAVYAADTTWTLSRRIIAGSSWREAHREHIYQRLADLMRSHSASAAIVTGFSAAICVVAMQSRANPIIGCLVIATLLCTYLSLPSLCQRLASTRQ